MYNLRIITNEGVESNRMVGESYTVIDRVKNTKAFDRVVEQSFKDGIEEEVHAFVVTGNGAIIVGLHEDSQAYIMTDKGGTFSNLTKKK